jgi:hypothetical protein
MRMLTVTMASIATITFALFMYALLTYSAPPAPATQLLSR